MKILHCSSKRMRAGTVNCESTWFGLTGKSQQLVVNGECSDSTTYMYSYSNKSEYLLSSQLFHLITIWEICQIPLVSHAEYLGVIIDKHLNWTEHFNMIANSQDQLCDVMNNYIIGMQVLQIYCSICSGNNYVQHWWNNFCAIIMHK